MPTSELRLGDCRDVLIALPSASVDAVVTDPPYELGFMGKGWDRAGIANDPNVWNNVRRVLKPGGHLLAFGGTRTFHRLACALEDAGFEIRDTLSFLYGSGFPKSLDVSKALDKQRDDRADVLRVTRWTNAAIKEAGVSFRAILQHFGFNDGSGQIGHWAALSLGAQPAVPTWEQWLRLKELLGFGDEMDNEVWRLNGRKGQPGEDWYERAVVGQGWRIDNKQGVVNYGGGTPEGAYDITAPATDLAAQWAGWGTALKPAWEPIILARKPLSGTVAANVAAHGTGALNIDATRIGTDDTRGKASPTALGVMNDDGWQAKPVVAGSTSGRWPANVVLDEAAATLLDEQSGERTGAHDGSGVFRQHAWMRSETPQHIRPDTGGASRFFLNVPADNEWYACEDCGIVRHIAELTSGCPNCGETMVPYRMPIDDPNELHFRYQAKASRAERNAGLDGMPERDDKLERYRLVKANPSREDGGPNETRPTANHHPTVKPIALMRWLCRLICPPNGTILDPFMGSGTTGAAAALEGFAFIGIEQDESYLAIAERRIAHWTAHACCRTQQLELVAD